MLMFCLLNIVHNEYRYQLTLKIDLMLLIFVCQVQSWVVARKINDVLNFLHDVQLIQFLFELIQKVHMDQNKHEPNKKNVIKIIQ